jgi:hypothetical protein
MGIAFQFRFYEERRIVAMRRIVFTQEFTSYLRLKTFKNCKIEKWEEKTKETSAMSIKLRE